MDDNSRHIEQLKEESSNFFAKGKIVWEKSEAEVWAKLENKITKKPVGKTVLIHSTVVKWSVAALFLLLIGLGSLVLFYSRNIESQPGQNIVADLPDGSIVELNAGSVLQYNPLKWRFERTLKFEGEAYFMVEKGKKFNVESENGITQVVGTSFNIYARDNDYRVTCFSGLVKVVSITNESMILSPNEHVEIEDGVFVKNPDYNTNKAIDWKMGMFDFSGRPLKEVFDEIERQFAVKIQIQPELYNRGFSSNFSKPKNVEEALDYVCKSMQLKYIKQSENVFLVSDKYR